MAATIPTTEPTALRAGDTWQWRREDLSDYPASAWTLTYYFRTATYKFDVAAAADGDAYAVSVAKATTAVRQAGWYDWEAYVEDAAERHHIGGGRIEIKPNLALDQVHDARGFARKMLDAIEAALLNRATGDQLDLLSTTLGDRGLTRDRSSLIDLRDKFRSEVRAEERKARRVRGNRILAAG